MKDFRLARAIGYYANVTAPPAPVRIRNKRPFALSVTSISYDGEGEELETRGGLCIDLLAFGQATLKLGDHLKIVRPNKLCRIS